jgi:DNA-binding GntR family transcriptional regulator
MMTTHRGGQTKGATALVSLIREAILVGELNPGQRLVESELSVQFNASRGSVREALMLLENDGLVARETNRGAWVRPVSKNEAIEITEVRSVLEGLCAARVATSATAAERQELKELGAAMQDAVKRGDVMTYSRVSQQVHLRIRDIAAHRTAAEVLNRLRYQSVRYQFSVALLPGRPSVGAKEHLAIIKAVVSGDADVAERVMRDHLLSVVDAIKQLPDTPSMPHRAI